MMEIDVAIAKSGLPRLEARLLMMFVTGFSRVHLIGHGNEVLGSEQLAQFEALVARRLAGEPVAYLLGEREFYGRPFKVSPAVLIPRPETEHLVEAVKEKAATWDRPRILDLGTGSGAIAVTLALELPNANVSAVDLSAEALAVAKENASALGAQIDWYQSSWFDAVPKTSRFEIVVSNPPYIAAHDEHLSQGDVRFEPSQALTDGGNGMQCLEAIASTAPHYLTQNGWLLVEHGYDQGLACRDLFEKIGFKSVLTIQDLAGLDRVTVGQWHEA